MKAAIYARKSTDDNDRSLDNKSVIRQIEHGREYAESKGWSVSDEHIYVDDGISGADFSTRQGLLRMLTKLAEFEIIIMSELSRLGREQWQTNKALADIQAKDVRVFFYLTDEELSYDSAVDKFLVNAVAFAAELEREKASQRSRDALERKARKGYNTGGVVYGYDNVPVFTATGGNEEAKSHTDYKINEEQATVVRRIFRMYSDGYGFTAIAKTLNGDPRYRDQRLKYFDGQTPPPPRKGTGSWAPSSIRSMLHNERYTGKVPFGKYRKTWKGGIKKREKTNNLLLVSRPELQIVSEELYRAVQDRLEAIKKTYLRDTGGNVWGRPGMGRDSKYLLTGLGQCSTCGANLSVIGGTAGTTNRSQIYYYGCSYYQNRGSTVCSNDHRIRMDVLDCAVLEAIENQVLTPEAVTYTVEKATQIATERVQEDPNRSQKIKDEIGRLRHELEHFMALIAGGDAPPSVLEQIRRRERRIAALEQESQSLEVSQFTDIDTKRLKRMLRERLTHFKALVYSDVPVARQALRTLLRDPMRFVPVRQNGKKGYTFEGQTPLGALVDPTYIKWRPQGDSNPCCRRERPVS